MATVPSSNLTPLYRDGSPGTFILYSLVGASSADTVALSTAFSYISQAFSAPAGPNAGTVTNYTTLAFTGTSINLALAGNTSQGTWLSVWGTVATSS